MSKTIPDRWLNYKAIGERIEGTRFIAFKVPLSDQINKSLDEIDRFDRAILLKTIPNLGIIIDLTNTHRYYQPIDYIRDGVEHIKLMIPGHATPPNYLVQKFKSYVTNFLKINKNNDKLIGVHCTHGVNRTGYLICNYMISQMTVKPEDAIKRFDNARGHKIERKNYLEALYDISGSNNDAYGTSNSKSYNSRELTNGQQCTTYKSWREHREPVAFDQTTDRRDRFERCRQDMLQNHSNYNRFNSAVDNRPNYNRFNSTLDNRNNNPNSSYSYFNNTSRKYSAISQQRGEETKRYESRVYDEASPTKQRRYTTTSNDNNDTYHYINDNNDTYSSRYRRPQQSSRANNSNGYARN